MLKSLKKGTYNPKEIPDDLLPWLIFNCKFIIFK
jgi:hypothetical protein